MSVKLYVGNLPYSFGDNELRELFAPFGEVSEGMEVVDSIFAGYGEEPDQREIERRGNEYLQQFPQLDYIETARIAD